MTRRQRLSPDNNGTVMSASQLRVLLKDLFSSQKLAVLATHGDGQPYSSLVAFATTDDLKHLLFATTRATRKYANIAADSRVAMLVDNRSNREENFHSAVAVTATGRAEEPRDTEKTRYVEIYLRKHPHMREFLLSPNCALLKVTIDAYYVVSRFQNVMVLRP